MSCNFYISSTAVIIVLFPPLTVKYFDFNFNLAYEYLQKLFNIYINFNIILNEACISDKKNYKIVNTETSV